MNNVETIFGVSINFTDDPLARVKYGSCCEVLKGLLVNQKGLERRRPTDVVVRDQLKSFLDQTGFCL